MSMSKRQRSAPLRALSAFLAFFIIFGFGFGAFALSSYADTSSEKKYVALTFDDGPHPGRTREILALLKEYDVKATFFVIGVNVEQWSDIVEEEIRDGHEVGNHTYSHKHLKQSKGEELKNDLIKTDKLITDKFGYRMRLFRPPEGVINDSVKRVAAEMNYQMVLWNVDTRDWANTKASKIISTVRQNTKSKDVILFHDYIVGESHTLEALETLIPWFIEEGYCFVTVSELMKL